ncbi:protein kinase domain-containing protein [Rugosimonospora acidiphila]|uniref:protein kinase domain-containing protein n=1 Tax=Rugosimonospora acidiphila TaxID=556531 RepID=UPI0031EEF3D5
MNDSVPSEEWVFAERYRVDAPIGRGGMGEVWSGYDRQLDRRVAIKLMHPAATPAARAGSAEGGAFAEAAALDRERFLREIRTTARLELPGIPAVYDFGIEESTGRIYLVMQLLYAQPLADLIRSRDYPADPWPISWAAAIAAQVAATLVDVHRVDVVHRDIKPSNLMVSASGLVKVLDFGVAILQGASALPKLTQIGMTVGSPPYMPPEQVLGNPVGPASDVYALGCVLYEMVTGRVPFVETTARSYQDHHVNTPPSSLRLLRSDVSTELDDLVVAMLAKRPADRPDAETVYDTLLPLVRSGPADASDDRDPRRPFLRPFAPAPRPPAAVPAARPPRAALAPLTIDEALDLHGRVAQLVQDSQLQQAIDVLDDAVDRAAHDRALQLEMRIELATTLYMADEFTRAAAVFDAVLPKLDGGEDVALLRYYAGVSHAETGDIDSAIEYLTAFLVDAKPDDPLYRDATYQLGMMLPAVGRPDEGLRYLEGLRPVLAAEYGSDSIHLKALERRIIQIRNEITGGP